MSSQDPIRVMIVDDHAMWRNILRDALRFAGNLECVGEASNGLEAVHLVPQLNPDVVLIDMMMPVMDGVAATSAIRKLSPTAKLIALTNNEKLARAALRAGAHSYLLKGVSVAVLAEAIETAHHGQAT